MSTATTRKILEGLARYRIREKIGSGGMATVYRAEDLVLRREVALKIMHDHLLGSPDAVRRFTNEAHAVASLSHENVIKVFDYGEVEGSPYLVMEHIKGPTLVSLAEKYGTLPNLVALETARQILSGLCAAHAKGIYHRDIKPDNIMIDADGTARIMDFGIAYIVNRESLTLTGSFIGSPRFISPEQAKGENLTGATDVFSLGVLLYRCLTGRVPFDADIPAAVVHAIIHDSPEPVCVRNKKILVWLSDFVDTCLIKDPGRRPDAAGTLALVDRNLLLHGLTGGKQLLCEYVKDPGRQRAFEEKKLFEHYRRRSREALEKRQVAAAIKALEQARAFGSLMPDDERAVRRFARRRRVTKVVAVVVCAALCAAAVVLIGKAGVRDDRVGPPDPGTMQLPLPEAEVNATPAPDKSGEAAAVPAPRAVKQRSGPRITAAAADTPSGVAPAPFPEKAPAWLSIKTNPPWAKVFIDQIERGTTPTRTVYSAGSGPHELKVVKEGFAVHCSTCIPLPGETLSVRVALVPLRATDQ
ncbi:MAG: serine/threonine protein kinase [Chitinispirillaceae bacterium]|nr:serine/threonine protein kinase [Chitinispirillaceae bacterium]